MVHPLFHINQDTVTTCVARLAAAFSLAAGMAAQAATPPALPATVTSSTSAAKSVGVPVSTPPASAPNADVSPGTASGKTEIVRADFGLFSPLDSGAPPFVSSKVVPLKPGQIFGWMIIVKTGKKKVKWREEFTLPAKPKSWGGPKPEGSRSITAGGRVSTLEREVEPFKDMILNNWSIAPGDPPGRYVIKVTVDGGPSRTFEFDVK